MELKMRINRVITATGHLGFFDITDENKVRFVSEGAGVTATVVVRARIIGQSNFNTLATLTGTFNEIVNVSTYEELEIECTQFSSPTGKFKLIAASFNDAGGSAIESIDVPSGESITNVSNLVFTSEDSSVVITGDNSTKTIDFSVASLDYTPADPSDWSPPPATIFQGVDQLADRVNTIEDTLPTKINSSEKGAPNGVVPLNSISKIDSTYLPSFVDDVVEYSSLTAFPLVGETSKLYVALDTNRVYRWSGSSYIEVSPSSVVSVNGYTDIVVLSKSDIGLSNVDNTSDLNKPISLATQDALDDLDDRIIPIEDRAEVLTVYAYENNAQVYADGQPGIKDPSALIRDGWYFKNDASSEKINWYYFDGTTQGNVTLGDLKSSYAVMTFDAVSSGVVPIIAIYTFPTGIGDVIPGFAHSRIVYDALMTPTPIAGTKYLIHAGENPPVHPELPRISLALVPSQSIGEKLPTEQILTVSFGSNSGASVNSVQYMVESLGLFSNPVKHEMDLRIRVASQLDLNTHVADVSNPHQVTKTQVGLGNVDNTSDLNKPISTATQTALNLKYDASNPANYITSAQAPVQSVNGFTNIVVLAADDIGFTPYGTISSSEVQSAIEELDDKLLETSNIALDTKEPTGFIDRTQSTTSFSDSTRIFTISPVSGSFSFYIRGTKFTKTTTQQITIPNLAGNHYIYFNLSGNLETTQSFTSSIIEQYAFVSVIYWNTDTNTHSYFAEERHGITMDGSTHSYLHTVFGARYLSGLALQDFTLGNGSSNSHAQFTVDSGSIRDEDLFLQLSAQSQIPILFKQGQLWRKKLADAFPLIYNDGVYYSGPRIPYNQFVAGTWQLTPVDSNKFVLVHFFATNDKESPVVGIQGIAQYNDIPAARVAASSEITSLSGLPFAEFVAIGTVIFQTNTYANTPDARVRDVDGANYVDFRGTQLYTPAGEATTHSLLSGLAADDHIQYLTEERGDARYYTKSQVDTTVSGLQTDINTRALDSVVIKKAGTVPFTGDQSMGGFKLTNLANPVSLTDAVNLQTLNAALGSSGDIIEMSFSLANNQSVASDVTGFLFSNSVVRSFNALVSITINATSSLYEVVELQGIRKASDWFMSINSEGDYSGVTLSINSSGQIQYTSPNFTGFVSGVIKFRAITTSA